MWQLTARFGGVGLEAVGCLIAGLLVGEQLDKWTSMEPFGLLFGLTVGTGAAIRALLATAAAARRQRRPPPSP